MRRSLQVAIRMDIRGKIKNRKVPPVAILIDTNALFYFQYPVKER